MDATQFKERRKDGWPLCPRCGEDELYSRYSPTLREIESGSADPILLLYLECGVKCYFCGWESAEFKRGG